jgi:hypothetical protein
VTVATVSHGPDVDMQRVRVVALAVIIALWAAAVGRTIFDSGYHIDPAVFFGAGPAMAFLFGQSMFEGWRRRKNGNGH